VLLGLADELGACFAIGSDEGLKEPIDLRLKSLGEGDRGTKTPCAITGRGITLFGETEEKSLDRIALQTWEPEFKLTKGARPKSAEAGEDLPFTG